MSQFVIKHKSSGKFVHPQVGSCSVCPNTNLNIWDNSPDYTVFEFEYVDCQWGYIKHVKSGYVIHPKGGSCNPFNGTSLVLHPDRHGGALFRYDQCNDQFVHKCGKYIHPYSGNCATPPNGTNLVIHQDVHDGMKFECVSPCSTSCTVNVCHSCRNDELCGGSSKSA